MSKLLTYQKTKRTGKLIAGISLLLFAFFTYTGIGSTIVFFPLILLILIGVGWWFMGIAMEIDYKSETDKPNHW
jgi:hypothetical protein